MPIATLNERLVIARPLTAEELDSNWQIITAFVNGLETRANITTNSDGTFKGLPLRYAGASAVGTDAYAGTLADPAITLMSEVLNTVVVFKADVASTKTGGATLSLNGLTATAIKKWDGGSLVDLEDGDIPAGGFAAVIYDGTRFILQTPPHGTTRRSLITILDSDGSPITPTADGHVATKKYVDDQADAVSNIATKAPLELWIASPVAAVGHGDYVYFISNHLGVSGDASDKGAFGRIHKTTMAVEYFHRSSSGAPFAMDPTSTGGGRSAVFHYDDESHWYVATPGGFFVFNLDDPEAAPKRYVSSVSGHTNIERRQPIHLLTAAEDENTGASTEPTLFFTTPYYNAGGWAFNLKNVPAPVRLRPTASTYPLAHSVTAVGSALDVNDIDSGASPAKPHNFMGGLDVVYLGAVLYNPILKRAYILPVSGGGALHIFNCANDLSGGWSAANMDHYKTVVLSAVPRSASQFTFPHHTSLSLEYDSATGEEKSITVVLPQWGIWTPAGVLYIPVSW